MKIMKADSLFLTVFVLISLFLPIFLVEPSAAAVIPLNNITIEKSGMTWEYKEQAEDNEAISFRKFVDTQTGNNNSFVNAWEILKAEKTLRAKMEEVLRTKPDVKLNQSSCPVKYRDIDFSIPEEALGITEKNSTINNSARVTYVFERELGEATDILFMGTPDSNLTISLPSGFDVKGTQGLEDKKLEFENSHAILKGSFDHGGNVTLWLLKNESVKADFQNTKVKIETESKAKGIRDKISKIFSYFLPESNKLIWLKTHSEKHAHRTN
jgi:hypothetical protein